MKLEMVMSPAQDEWSSAELLDSVFHLITNWRMQCLYNPERVPAELKAFFRLRYLSYMKRT